MEKIVFAIVGMTGSGKSEVAQCFRNMGVPAVRFGDITEEELARRGLPITPANEKLVREGLRQEHGMAVYAHLSLPKLQAALESSNFVVADGMYSFAEYKVLRAAFGDALRVIAVFTDRDKRYLRLAGRKVRPLTPAEAWDRDVSEIENLEKGGPIALADHTLMNNGSLELVSAELHDLIESKYIPVRDSMVIYSEAETEANCGEPMFWGNRDGWGGLGSADRYWGTSNFNLPLPDGRWITLTEARHRIAKWLSAQQTGDEQQKEAL